MSKNELIEAIRRLNRTVSAEFLNRFGETDLRAYLERIAGVLGVPAPESREMRREMCTTIDADQDLNIA
jgi:hypothetical protein